MRRFGILKDQPFNPDTDTREFLDQAAKAGYQMSRVIGLEQDFIGGISFRVFPDRQWLNPMADATSTKPGGAKDTA